MKNVVKTVVSVLLILTICLTASSCGVFKSMRENAEKAKNIEIMETPDDDTALKYLNEYMKSSVEEALSATESISYSADDVQILDKNGEKAGLLADSAKQLRNFIMAGKPGASDRDVTADDMGLMQTLDKAGILNFEITRTMASEQVTDEKENPVAGEDGAVLTTQYIADNILHLVLSYFDTKVTETKTNEDGSVEETTEIVPADDEAIRKVFGEDADKEAVLAAFDCVKDYVELKDYTVSYNDCRISSDLDLVENVANFVRFEKNMIVTANVAGAGVLADYGELTVTMKLRKTANYSFTFAAEE